MIDNIKIPIKAMESGINSEHAPVFSMNNFNMCSGPIASGHYHVPGCYEKYFYYTGSPYRWAFGEEESKGFLVLLYNLDSRKHLGRMVEIVSEQYVTVDMRKLSGMDAKSLRAHIDALRQSGIEHLRIKYADVLNEEQMTDMRILKEYYRNDSSIKIEERSKKEIKTEEMDERYTRFKYVLDPSIPDDLKLMRFINDNEGEGFITLDELNSLIKED
jgi:DNA repair exonuclease SbcCD nuclease subunit